MSFDFVLFGGTGDLAWRKLLPALFQSFRHGSLPPNGRIIAVGRSPFNTAEYRNFIATRFNEIEAAKQPNPDEFARFALLLEYLQMDLSLPDDYAKLACILRARQAATTVMYVATAPGLFTTVCEQLAHADLNQPNVRIVLEKPLGHNLASNQAINASVRRFFAEKQIFRIDHYLGKPAVQNLFALRFGNAFFEPIWRREYIQSVHINIDEELGVESRGAFYDTTGALRDMVQNHALQLLCAIAMEPPINRHADAIRDEKLKVLRSLKPWSEMGLKNHTIHGQYTAGTMHGEVVPGYRDELGIAPNSHTETFVALRTEIVNWRWAGVPFYICTGKRLAQRDARIVINFRPTPHSIFDIANQSGNQLVIKLQPHDGLELHLFADAENNPQIRMLSQESSASLTPVQLDLDFDKRFGSDRVGAYERLLLDVLANRLNLFVRSDEQEEAWRWVEPILQKQQKIEPSFYAAGSAGPKFDFNFSI